MHARITTGWYVGTWRLLLCFLDYKEVTQSTLVSWAFGTAEQTGNTMAGKIGHQGKDLFQAPTMWRQSFWWILSRFCFLHYTSNWEFHESFGCRQQWLQMPCWQVSTLQYSQDEGGNFYWTSNMRAYARPRIWQMLGWLWKKCMAIIQINREELLGKPQISRLRTGSARTPLKHAGSRKSDEHQNALPVFSSSLFPLELWWLQWRAGGTLLHCWSLKRDNPEAIHRRKSIWKPFPLNKVDLLATD